MNFLIGFRKYLFYRSLGLPRVLALNRVFRAR